MEKTYNLSEIAMMSGFTERTLRSYLKQGLLNGEKTDGKWQFSEEEIDRFFSDPYVREGLRIKRSSVVFDFLSAPKTHQNHACVIIDRAVSLSEGTKISAFFCEEMQNAKDVTFNYGYDDNHCRIILAGDEAQVAGIMKKFNEADLS